jgi:hypothetical protein
LHVTNGDSVVYLFKKAGIPGTYLAWQDVLHEGPVPGGLSLEALSEVRASYIASRGYASPIKAIHDFRARDAALRAAAEASEIVLWFEHDLFDQLQLLQILVALDEMQLDPGRVSLIQSEHYLGMMTAEELTALWPRRRVVTKAVWSQARAAWDDFTAPTPDALDRSATREHSGLPFLRAALERLREEYPSVRDGLNRSERHALQAVAAGPGPADELFRRAQAREEAPFAGDAVFAATLSDLARGDDAAISGVDGALEPTALGRRILSGDGQWRDARAAHRWIGGVQLAVDGADRCWRFDDDAGRFVEP